MTEQKGGADAFVAGVNATSDIGQMGREIEADISAEIRDAIERVLTRNPELDRVKTAMMAASSAIVAAGRIAGEQPINPLDLAIGTPLMLRGYVIGVALAQQSKTKQAEG